MLSLSEYRDLDIIKHGEINFPYYGFNGSVDKEEWNDAL